MAIADIKTAPPSEVIENSVQAAKKLLKHQMHELEDFRDATALKVRKAPLTSVSMAVGVGMLLGAALGFIAAAYTRKKA